MCQNMQQKGRPHTKNSTIRAIAILVIPCTILWVELSPMSVELSPVGETLDEPP